MPPEERMKLMEEAELAVHKCLWCYKYGHKINDCPKYIAWLVEQHEKQARLEKFQRPDDSLGKWFVVVTVVALVILGVSLWAGK